MGWRFRHSFKIIPGVRLNLSKSGLSCSVGGAPFTFNVGPHGAFATASIPGTGISYRQRLTEPSQSPPASDPSQPFQTPNVPPVDRLPFPDSAPFPHSHPLIPTPIEEVRSASTELLTSSSLKELKQVMQMAHDEREDISRHLDASRLEKAQASKRYSSWNEGILFKRLFKRKFAQRKIDFETAEAKVAELEQQLKLTTIAGHVEIESGQAEPYFRLRDEFASLSECASIWDIKTHQATDKFHERTIASMRVGRERVKFSLGSCDLLQWEQKVPHLENAKGGSLFLFPGFILYRAAKEAFSVIDFHDVNVIGGLTQFHEEEGVPGDSEVVGSTWAKANKDGSRDMRFADNHQIPITHYGSLILKSGTGLWEEFLFSNPKKLARLVDAWKAFVVSFIN